VVEYHGWATVCEDPHDMDTGHLEEITTGVQQHVGMIDAPNRVIGARWVNGNYTVWFAGFTNHWARDVDQALELFRFIAEAAPGAYGLLYLWDDEHEPTENEFQVWRLARGALTKMSDPFLSPCIPTFEDPYDPSRDRT
jgi:hypothetical protein